MLKKFTKSKKGFTLVELMVVVVIIGILVAIAIPAYTGVTQSANAGAVKATLKTIQESVKASIADGAAATSLDTAAVAANIGWTAMPTNSPTGVTYTVTNGIGKATVTANVVKGFLTAGDVYLGSDGLLTATAPISP